MRRWHRLFDDRFDDVCRFEPKAFIARVIAAVMTGALMGVSMGAGIAAVWSAAFVLCESAVFVTTRPITDGRSARPGQRLALGNYPRPCRGLNQAVTTPRMVWNLLAPGLRRAVSMTVRISASPWAAHMAR